MGFVQELDKMRKDYYTMCSNIISSDNEYYKKAYLNPLFKKSTEIKKIIESTKTDNELEMFKIMTKLKLEFEFIAICVDACSRKFRYENEFENRFNLSYDHTVRNGIQLRLNKLENK